jgi:hypothetical protein
MVEIAGWFVNDPNAWLIWSHYPVLWWIIVVIVIYSHGSELRLALSHIMNALVALMGGFQEVLQAFL